MPDRPIINGWQQVEIPDPDPHIDRCNCRRCYDVRMSALDPTFREMYSKWRWPGPSVSSPAHAIVFQLVNTYLAGHLPLDNLKNEIIECLVLWSEGQSKTMMDLLAATTPTIIIKKD